MSRSNISLVCVLAFNGLFAGLLSGCAVTVDPDSAVSSDPIPEVEKLDENHVDLIVIDLVSAMVQVRELAPLTTTLQLSTPRGVFGYRLVEMLEKTGYGLQYVSEDQGANYVSYANRSIESNAGFVQDFLIRVGGIEITREYKVAGGKVVPTAIMYVSGTQSFGNILLNESIFLQQGGQLDFENGVEVELLDSTVQATNVTSINQNEEAGAALDAVTALISARNNTVEKSEEQLLLEKLLYKPIKQAAITFSDTSLMLGKQNKAVVKKLLNDYQASRDAFFINSCSSTNASKAVAERHSLRIIEELLLHGVPRQLIAEEGCFEAEYPEGVIIPRTVMVTQRRHADSVNQISSAQASFPNRPLAMTIPYGAGGATDFQARIVTMVAAEENFLGQPVTIINKPGEGGRAGWSWFAENAADTGYDIATYNVPHFIAQSIKFGTPYNIDTLEPLGNWGADPAVLVVPFDSNFLTLRDYLLFARRNPGKVTVSGAGLYVGHHIALLQLEKAAAVKLDYRTAKGGAAALTQVVEAEMMSGFNNLSDVYRLGDKVRVLAIADLQRHALMPEVPTFKELAVDVDDSSVNYRGLMVPKGTKQSVIDLLSDAAVKMFNSPLVNERMQEGGSPMKIMTREQVTAMWQERQRGLTDLLKGL